MLVCTVNELAYSSVAKHLERNGKLVIRIGSSQNRYYNNTNINNFGPLVNYGMEQRRAFPNNFTKQVVLAEVNCIEIHIQPDILVIDLFIHELLD